MAKGQLGVHPAVALDAARVGVHLAEQLGEQVVADGAA